MRPVAFDYVRPSTPEEATAAMAAGGTALAGGQSLLPLLKMRAVRPTVLVDLNRIGGLQGIGVTDELVIGSMTRHQRLADDPRVDSGAPLLAEAARRTGDVQVRARGTIGGNLCFADPRANLSTALLALGASATVESTEAGSRRVPVSELFADTRVTSLRPGELLTSVHVPLDPGAARGVYLEVAPQPGGVPIVNVAVVPGPDGPRIAVGGLLRTTCRAPAVEEAVRQDGPAPSVIERALLELTADRPAFSDPRGDPAYRSTVAAVLIRRALERADALVATFPEERA